MSGRALFTTADGSQTIILPDGLTTFHSRHGAVQESRHIFIENGFRKVLADFDDPVRIFEVGFGTGLNAVLTLTEAEALGRRVDYYSVEKFPLEEGLYKQLDYSVQLGESISNKLLRLHTCEWNKKQSIAPTFSLTKLEGDLVLAKLPEDIHLVYFDAFAPGANPDLWQAPVFERIFHKMRSGGCLVTFCAKGEVKRTLKKVGFFVENLAGPPGKREMTRAIKLHSI